MNKIIKCLMACIFLSITSAYADEMASEASIKELLEITHAESLLESSLGQMDLMLQKTMTQAISGNNLNSEQQKIMDDFRNKYIEIFKEAMNWKSMEGDYINIYKKSFTQNEIDGMIAFYKTEPGKAVIVKMPLVMQNTMESVQVKIMALMPKIQQMQKDTLEKIKAASPQLPANKSLKDAP